MASPDFDNKGEVVITQDGTLTTVVYNTGLSQIIGGLLLIAIVIAAFFSNIVVFRLDDALERFSASMSMAGLFAFILIVQRVTTVFDATTKTITRKRAWSFARLIPLWTWKASYAFSEVSTLKVTHKSAGEGFTEYRMWLCIGERSVFIAAEHKYLAAHAGYDGMHQRALLLHKVLGKSVAAKGII